jgi:hypothetical protein
MNRLAKRYLITGVIGIAAMLATLGFVLLRASDKVGRADAKVTPSFGQEAKKAAVPSASATAVR